LQATGERAFQTTEARRKKEDTEKLKFKIFFLCSPSSSALASRLLSRENSETLLLLGTGKIAPFLIRAHASVRPLKRILLWGRSPEKAATLRDKISAELPEIHFETINDLPSACGKADIVVCATGSPDILVHGGRIKPGTHTDFIGNHHKDKRECDTELVIKSSV
jgi:1-pyrroline-2-carboxylate reductase [NAD(P)H]